MADEYQLVPLKQACHQVLLSQTTSTLEYVTLAQKHDLPDLLDKAIKDCAAKFPAFYTYDFEPTTTNKQSIESQLRLPENKDISLQTLNKLYK